MDLNTMDTLVPEVAKREMAREAFVFAEDHIVLSIIILLVSISLVSWCIFSGGLFKIICWAICCCCKKSGRAK